MIGATRLMSDRGKHDRRTPLTLDVETAEERRREELGLQLRDDIARGRDSVEVALCDRCLAVHSPAKDEKRVGRPESRDTYSTFWRRRPRRNSLTALTSANSSLGRE